MKALGKLLYLVSTYITEGCKLVWYKMKQWFCEGYYGKK